MKAPTRFSAVLVVWSIAAVPLAMAQSPVRLNEVIANNVSVENAGMVADWVELFNPTDAPVDISDAGLSDTSSSLRRYAFRAGSIVPAGGRLVIYCNSLLAASSTNTGFGLKATGGSVYFSAKPANGGGVIDSLQYGIQAANYSLSCVPDGSGNWVLGQPTPGEVNSAVTLGAPAVLRVNEWMANPRSGPDYFEIYNPGSRPLDLGGLWLTDSLSNPQKYRIPPLSFIGVGAEGAFALFYAENGPDANFTQFSLKADGEALGIYNGTAQMDAVTFGAQSPGVSSGRFPDGSANIVNFDFSPSPGRSNQSLSNLTDIVINELLTHTDPPLEDAIEFKNTTGHSINMKGWRFDAVEEQGGASVKTYVFPMDFVVPAHGYAVLYEYQFSGVEGLRFNSAHGGEITLYQADASGYFTAFKKRTYEPAENGVSFGLTETSEGEEWVAQSSRSFGSDRPSSVGAFRKGKGLPNPGPKVGPVVIAEIHYHPPDTGSSDNSLDEFIELRNIHSGTVPLFDPVVYLADKTYVVNGETIVEGSKYADGRTNTWRLRGDVDFDFPRGLSLRKDEHLLIVNFDPTTNIQQLASFKGAFPGIPDDAIIVGPYRGKLENGSGNLDLRRPDPPQGPNHREDFRFVPYVTGDHVHYKDSAPWPPGADGTGAALQKRFAGRTGSEPQNWKVGTPTPGRRNAEPPVLTSAPQNVTYVFGDDVAFAIGVSGSEPILYQWSFNGSPIPDGTNATLILENLQLSQVGQYSVVAANDEGSVMADAALRLDSVRPILTVDSPKPNIVWGDDRIQVQGTVRDDFGVARVLVRLNGGGFQLAVGTTNWSAELSLAAGTNVIQVVAVDLGENSSPTNTLRVVRIVLSPFHLTIAGSGTVGPNLNGQALEVGRNYTLTATPSAGQAFSNWIGGFESTANPLTFVMRSNLALQANFVPNPFIAAKGAYSGLFYDETNPQHASAGFFAATVADSGAFSAQLIQGSKKYPFSGRIGLDGNATNRVSLGGTNSAVVELNLDFSDPFKSVRGRVVSGSWESALFGQSSTFGAGNSTAFSGSHTLILFGSDSPGEPAGDGYGSLTISSSGAVKFGGVLADVTKISVKSSITLAGHWPFYASLYGGNGSAFGWLRFLDGDPLTSIEGSLYWSKPAKAKDKLYPGGFRATTTAIGSEYTRPASGQRIVQLTNSVVTLSGGELVEPIVCEFELASNNRVVNLSSNKFSLKFTTATGLFGGSVADPVSGRNIPFKGALLENLASGAGNFSGANESGRVRIGN